MASRKYPFSASSTTLSFLVVVGLFLIGFLPLLSKLTGVGPVGTRETTDQTTPDTAAPGGKDGWTETAILRGREECMHVLQSVAAEVDLLAPVKQDSCGGTAPVRLKSLGSSPKVVFDPPVEINCRLMAALHRWNKLSLQPAARDILGSPVRRIAGASGYSCRTVYNFPAGNLSQHAFANAIDVAAFELEDGRNVTVLKGWGPTARDLAALAKAKSAPAASKAPSGRNATAKSAPPATGRSLARASLSLKTTHEKIPASSAARAAKADVGMAPLKPTPATRFLRRLHDGACREFETVLGPEANDVHRNHFHFDLTPLRGHSHCQ